MPPLSIGLRTDVPRDSQFARELIPRRVSGAVVDTDAAPWLTTGSETVRAEILPTTTALNAKVERRMCCLEVDLLVLAPNAGVPSSQAALDELFERHREAFAWTYRIGHRQPKTFRVGCDQCQRRRIVEQDRVVGDPATAYRRVGPSS